MNNRIYERLADEYADPNYGYNIAIQLNEMVNSELGGRTAGSDAGHRAADWLIEEMKRIGLKDVKKEEFSCAKWQFNGSELRIIEPQGIEKIIRPYSYASGGTSGNNITAELIYLEKGTKNDYKGVNAQNKIILIDIDMSKDWWISAPTLEAKLHGAAAIINSCSGGYSQISKDALNTHNFSGPVSIPSVNISRNDAEYLKKLLDKGPVTANLAVDNIVEPVGKGFNLTGTIPGKRDDEYIIIGDHYDCHFWGFQDNNCAVGLTLAIARGLISSGYQPERTLIFILHDAEEWGAIGTPYDWCIGAWKQVFRVRPEWSGKALVYINFELPAYEFAESTYISATPELNSFLIDFIPKAPKPAGCFKAGIRTKIYPLTTWSDDWSYSIAGIPSLVSGFSFDEKDNLNEFHHTIYHSQFDNPDTYNESVFTFNLKFYSALALQLDQRPALELDFSHQAERFAESIDRKAFGLAAYDPGLLISEIKELKEVGLEKYRQLKELNRIYIKIRKAESTKSGSDIAKQIKEATREANKRLLEAYKIFQDKLTKLYRTEFPIFGHEQVQKNILIESESIIKLKEGDIHTALDKLVHEIDNADLSYCFSKEVVQHFIERIYAPNPDPADNDNLFWGKGRNVGYTDLYDTIQALLAKQAGGDLSKEIAALENILKGEKKLLAELVSEEIEGIHNTTAKLKQIDLHSIIEMAKDEK